MDLTETSMSSLFAQLGLDNSKESISRFVANHKVPSHIHLANAEFWTKGQASFLAEAIAEDGAWSEAVEHLDALLRK